LGPWNAPADICLSSLVTHNPVHHKSLVDLGIRARHLGVWYVETLGPLIFSDVSFQRTQLHILCHVHIHLLKGGKREVDTAFFHLGFADLPRPRLVLRLHLRLVPWNSSLNHLAILLPRRPPGYCHVHHHWNSRWNLLADPLICGFAAFLCRGFAICQVSIARRFFHPLTNGPWRGSLRCGTAVFTSSSFASTRSARCSSWGCLGTCWASAPLVPSVVTGRANTVPWSATLTSTRSSAAHLLRHIVTPLLVLGSPAGSPNHLLLSSFPPVRANPIRSRLILVEYSYRHLPCLHFLNLLHGAGFDIFTFFRNLLVRLLQLLIHPSHFVSKRLGLHVEAFLLVGETLPQRGQCTSLHRDFRRLSLSLHTTIGNLMVLAKLCVMNLTTILPDILTHLFVVVETFLSAQTTVFSVHSTALVSWTRRSAWIVPLPSCHTRVVSLPPSATRIDA